MQCRCGSGVDITNHGAHLIGMGWLQEDYCAAEQAGVSKICRWSTEEAPYGQNIQRRMQK